MADHKLEAFAAFLEANHEAGQSLQEFHQKLKPFGANLRDATKQSQTISSVNLGNSESFIGQFIAPFDLEITAIYGVKQASAGSAVTATLANVAANPLTATNIDMDALAVANTPESQALSATPANLLMSAGDCLKCTFACDGSSTLTGGGVAIIFKPTA